MLLIIYLIGILEQVKGFFEFILFMWFILLACLIVFKVFLFVEQDLYDADERARKHLLTRFNKALFLVVGLISIVFHVFTPDKNTLYAMAGIYIGKEIIENPRVESIMTKSLDAIDIKLDEIIEGKKHEQASATE